MEFKTLNFGGDLKTDKKFDIRASRDLI